MALPGGLTDITTQNTTVIISGFPTEGALVYKYSPFQNLQVLNPAPGEPGLQELRMTSLQAGVAVDTPLVLDTEVAYDGSVNLVISDKTNPLKIVNSRFYLIDSSNYAIADRVGNLDTNIYTVNNFQTEASLIKAVKSVITLDFIGVYSGGILPVGNYNFYFKLADFDGNEFDFICESGQVVCYIGTVNNPSSIRGGQLNENSEKLVKLQLNNLDMAYDYINIYYSRTTGDELNETTTVFKITNKFRITGTSTAVTITGYEDVEPLSLSDLNIRYSNFDHVKALSTCQNMVFAGNIHNNYELFILLQNYSLFVYPSITLEENIGNLTSAYVDPSSNGGEYYNPNNIYYRLGYWDEEIYRFGIVYILNDYTLTPVFNIRGIATLSEVTTLPPAIPSDQSQGFTFFTLKEDPIGFDENYTIINSLGLKTTENTKGVFRINLTGSNDSNGNPQTIFNGVNGTNPITPIGIKISFDSQIISSNSLNLPLLNTITRGFFIVRQKRIPTILAQGVSIATTKQGYIPTIENDSGFMLESFLADKSPVGSSTSVPTLGRSTYHLTSDQVVVNSLLCPEATMRKSTYSSLFNSSSFHLKPFKYQPKKKEFSNIESSTANPPSKLFTADNLVYVGPSSSERDTDLLLVDSEITLIGNKNNYYSSVAGNAIEPWKHTDPINGNIEDVALVATTPIQDAAISNSIQKTRGIFNSYVGTSIPSTDTQLQSMCYYNIFNTNYATNASTMLEYFIIRFNDSSIFAPVSDRISWKSFGSSSPTISCYRGDCYINTYTHRMLWNFIDPDLPTNKRVIDPFTWYKNYKVRTTQVKVNNNFVVEDGISGTNDSGVFTTANSSNNSSNEVFQYRKILPLFTYKISDVLDNGAIDQGNDLSKAKLLLPETKSYGRFAKSNGEFGATKINRADINAIGLGHWVTFKICSNINLALRDEDFSNPGEEALQKRRRSFYPYTSADITNSLPESTIINKGISATLGNRYYFEIPEVPFMKTHFTNRIYH